MIVQFVNRQSKYPVRIWQELISRVLPQALARAGHWPVLPDSPEPAVTIMFAGPRLMRRINRETRGIDQITDVLSFPLLDMREGHLVQQPGVQDLDFSQRKGPLLPLGDLVIAPERALQQAHLYGHGPDREMAFLAVHGLLHLIGYDHDDPERERTMQALQESILIEAGLPRNRAGLSETPEDAYV